jgi:hypothetical protein
VAEFSVDLKAGVRAKVVASSIFSAPFALGVKGGGLKRGSP